MKEGKIYGLIKNSKKKLLAVLVDPDKCTAKELKAIATSKDIDLLLVGSSILLNGNFESTLDVLKKQAKAPVVIFPGNIMQLSKKADGILLLSLISGRNPEMLIGNQVIAAPAIKAAKLEVLPTGYILIESGNTTSVSYMSNTMPIPHDKNDIAACTALAGEQLGLKMIYMDGGSGAKKSISTEMIKKVKQEISIPLIIGGGINSPEAAKAACMAGADMIVIGSAVEKDVSIITKFAKTIHSIPA